jgi:hypothetical protein
MGCRARKAQSRPLRSRMEAETPLVGRLVELHFDAVRLGPRVAADAGQLPRDLLKRETTADDELVIGHFGLHEQRCMLTDWG